MADFIKTQSTFADGEVAPEFYARDNINGLSQLENMDVLSGGGLTRRRGLVAVATLPSSARLIPFSVGEGEEYLIALSGTNLSIYRDGVRVQDLLPEWPASAIPRIQYAQRFGTMIFVHPDYRPQILEKYNGLFRLKVFDFLPNDSDLSVNIPFMRFDDSLDVNITITTHTNGNNFATFTTNKDFWSSDYVNTRFLINGQQWRIAEYISPTQVCAFINGGYTIPSGAITDWREAAFSTHRGWPSSITFHQDRLVFGGSRSHPSGIWMSQVGRHNNFNVGTGLDDEAISITLLSDQRQQICTVVSSDNLQILTTTGEWAISSKPLTPSVVDIKQHTSVGSIATRYLSPQKVEGATVFVGQGGQEIRELGLDELGENYNATDLCALAKHLMRDPVDIAYNDATRQLFVVRGDGDMAVLNHNSALGISAWCRYKTQGKFISVASISGETFVIVERDGDYCLEKFSSNALSDPDGREFTFVASAMPLRASGHNPAMCRVRKISARVLDTRALFINDVRITLPGGAYDENSTGYSGDVGLNILGTLRDGAGVLWRIHGKDSLPLTVLSVTMHGYYTV